MSQLHQKFKEVFGFYPSSLDRISSREVEQEIVFRVLEELKKNLGIEKAKLSSPAKKDLRLLNKDDLFNLLSEIDGVREVVERAVLDLSIAEDLASSEEFQIL